MSVIINSGYETIIRSTQKVSNEVSDIKRDLARVRVNLSKAYDGKIDFDNQFKSLEVRLDKQNNNMSALSAAIDSILDDVLSVDNAYSKKTVSNINVSDLLNAFGTVTSVLTGNSIKDFLNRYSASRWADISAALFGTAATAWSIIKDEISNIPKEAKIAGEALDVVEKWYEKSPREVKAVVNIVVPSSLKKAYEISSDLIQGDLTVETIWSVEKSITKGSPYVTSVFEVVEYTFEKGMERSEEMQNEIDAQIEEGDVLGAVVDGAEGFVDTIIGGTVECMSTLAGNKVDEIIGDIPFVGNAVDEGVKYITGKIMPDGSEYSLGDLVSAGGEAISEGIDYATDVITDAADVVTSKITSGVKGVCSWISGWFD